MQIELNPEEIRVLRVLIENEIKGINPEIHHTGSAEMRDELKAHRDTLQKLLARLTAERT
ncbi:MAG: hypothetical protein IPM18_03405 [Phycisphaerales bacterium]|nr:hypothetical protein [Phycisphaerales bacterium]